MKDDPTPKIRVTIVVIISFITFFGDFGSINFSALLIIFISFVCIPLVISVSSNLFDRFSYKFLFASTSRFRAVYSAIYLLSLTDSALFWAIVFSKLFSFTKAILYSVFMLSMLFCISTLILSLTCSI